MLILQRIAMAASNSFLFPPLLKPSLSHFPKRVVSIPTCCLYTNMKIKKNHTTASAIATDASETATMSQNDDVEKRTTTTQNEKTEKLVLPTNESSEKLLRIRHTVAVLGSLERFFGVLIEHYAGDFPLWLSPVQARVLPVTDIQLEYCNEVTNKLKTKGIRAEVCHGERLPKLVRNAEKQRIPLMAVVGPKEVEMKTVTVRSRFGGELGTMTIDDFISRIKSATENRTSF